MKTLKPHTLIVAGALLAGFVALLASTARAQEEAPSEEAEPPSEEGEPSSSADGEEATSEEEEAPSPAEDEEPSSAAPEEGEDAAEEGQAPPPEETAETADAPKEGPASGATAVEPETEPEQEIRPDEEPPPSETTEAEAGGSWGSASLQKGVVPEEKETPADEDLLDDVTAQQPRDHLVWEPGGHRVVFKISGAYEVHSVLDSADYGPNDWFSYYMLRLDANITKYDQVSIRMDMEQQFVADPGEAGLYFGDMRFYYSRKFAIPIPEFPIPGKASFYLTAPTSRESQERTYTTMPTGILTLAPGWGPLTLLTQGYFRFYHARYDAPDTGAIDADEGTGDNMNTRYMGGYALQLVYTPTDWFAPSVTWQQYWQQKFPAIPDHNQPWQPYYAFEVAADFGIPTPPEWPTVDVVLAWYQGYPFIDDGVYRMYFLQRDATQFYLGLNLVY